MTEKTWFERKFDDNLLARDLVLASFLVFGFGILFKILLDFIRPSTGITLKMALATGVLFAALWLPIMEIMARREDSSIFRYFLGGDPLEEN